jgi:hypothetical protein
MHQTDGNYCVKQGNNPHTAQHSVVAFYISIVLYTCTLLALNKEYKTQLAWRDHILSMPQQCQILKHVTYCLVSAVVVSSLSLCRLLYCWTQMPLDAKAYQCCIDACTAAGGRFATATTALKTELHSLLIQTE